MAKCPRLATVELYRNDMKFSAAHFTIFNATERERLHGHNYQVRSSITAAMQDDGITYDYSISRKKILMLCRSLNEYMLLPEKSPHLSIEAEGDFYKVIFNKRSMYFLQAETILLPIENTTSECLAEWFLSELMTDKADLAEKCIKEICVSVSTTVGQRSSVVGVI